MQRNNSLKWTRQPQCPQLFTHVRRPDGLEPLADRLVFVDVLAVDRLDVGHVIGPGPSEEVVQPGDLQSVGGHHQLAALLVRDLVLVAVPVRRV